MGTFGGGNIPKLIEVECHYCGSFIEVSKAVKLNLESGEYVYICDNCAIKWKKSKGGDKDLRIVSTETESEVLE